MVAARTGLDNCSAGTASSRVTDRPVSAARPHFRGRANSRSAPGPGKAVRSALEKGRRVGQRTGNASIETASYLRTAEVADILYVSPKTVSRWAKEGKLPFMKTLGGHRRYPEAKIRELASELREQPTA